MFLTWMKEHDFKDYPLNNRLFPPAADRAYWEQFLGQEQIREAEACLGCDWPLIRASAYVAYEKTGDRMVHEKPHFARRHQLINLFVGELAEGKGRFLSDICDGIFAICEETYWGVSAHKMYTKKDYWLPDAAEPYLDLFSAETAELLAVIYHILGEELGAYCPGILERIEYEINKHIVTQYLNHSEHFWMGRFNPNVNNWNPWILSNLLTVFLVMDMRQSQRLNGLRRMFEEINRYYHAMPDDGGCDEGPVYWTKAAGKLLSFCDQLYIASNGKINLFGDEKLKRIGQYEVKAYIHGLHVASFADGSGRLKNFQPDYELYVYGLRTGDLSMCALAATLKRIRGNVDLYRSISVKAQLFSLIYAREIDAQPEFKPEERYVLPNLQAAFMRSGAWYYAAKGGHNDESHNHNDVGNCIVYHAGAPVLMDSGSAVYTKATFSEDRYSLWNTQSGWHNLPVINGTQQKEGRQYAADGFAVDEKSTEISFAGAYLPEAKVEQAKRKVNITQAGVTIQDSFVFSGQANTVQEHFITTLKPEITEDGAVLGGKYLLKTPAACQVEWKDFEGDEALFESWQTQGLYRISFTLEGGKNLTAITEIRSV